MDFCKATSEISPTSLFYAVSPGPNAHGPKAIQEIPRCDIILSNQEDTESIWKNIKPFNKYFKCARVQGTNNFDITVVSINKNKKLNFNTILTLNTI